MRKALVLLLVLVPLFAWGQGSCVLFPSTLTTGAALTDAKSYVCSKGTSANSCVSGANAVSVFSDESLGSQFALTQPVTADSSGNTYVCALSGTYEVCTTSSRAAGAYCWNQQFYAFIGFVGNVVAYSATPTFDATAGNNKLISFEITLSGNVTSSTFQNGTVDEVFIMHVCQDGVGGHTFVYPTSLTNTPTIASGANACTDTLFFTPDGVNGFAVASSTGGGSGITSINAQSGPSVTIQMGTSGTAPNLTAVGNTITINVPDASPTADGTVNTAAQEMAGAKTWDALATFKSGLQSTSTSVASEIDIKDSGVTCGAGGAGEGYICYDSAHKLKNTVEGNAGTYSKMLQGYCLGTATAASTLGLYLLGQLSTQNCTSTIVNVGPPVPAGTVIGLRVKCTTAGVNASSGVFTVLKNGVATALTCTVGTGTSCTDNTHAATFADGDNLQVQFTTQASETLTTCRATVEEE